MQSKTKHQIDSPLLSHFIKECVLSKKKIPGQSNIEELRKELENDPKIIQTHNLGEGSFRRSNKRFRSIRNIARSAVSGKHKCQLLFKCLSYFQGTEILELGMSLGISTLYLSAAAPGQSITTVEGNEELVNHMQDRLSDLSSNIHIVNNLFHNSLENFKRKEKLFDFVYIDGDHNPSRLEEYLDLLQPVLKPQHTIVIDDIYWSKRMSQKWDEIISKKDYDLHLDLWYFGILSKQPSIKEPITEKILPVNLSWKPGLFR